MEHFPQRVELGERIPEMIGVDGLGAEGGGLVLQLGEPRIHLSDGQFGFTEVLGDRCQRLMRVRTYRREPLDPLTLSPPIPPRIADTLRLLA